MHIIITMYIQNISHFNNLSCCLHLAFCTVVCKMACWNIIVFSLFSCFLCYSNFSSFLLKIHLTSQFVIRCHQQLIVKTNESQTTQQSSSRIQKDKQETSKTTQTRDRLFYVFVVRIMSWKVEEQFSTQKSL